MKRLFSIVSFVLLFFTLTFGQAAVDIQLSGSDGSATIPLAVGLDLSATNCIDPSLGEAELPPLPPAGIFDIRFDLAPYGCPTLTVARDYRPAPSFPYTGTVQHRLTWQRSASGLPVSIAYDLPTGAQMTIQDEFGGVILNLGPYTGSGTAVVPGTVNLSAALVIMNYTNIGPTGPAPIFSINPPSLSFGAVAIGNSSTLQATVSNTGNADLTISNVTSSDPQFTFSPNSFPVTVTAGGSQVFDVTFAPTSTGVFNAHLTFTHNAQGSPTQYNISGTGADAGPTFSVSPASLNFGNVGVNTTTDKIVTVTNLGLTNTLNITTASIAETGFSVSPNTASIPPQGTQVFTVTFNPTSGGQYTGSLQFTDNAPGSPHTVPLSGNAVAVFGLIFEKDTVRQLEDDSYAETMQLKGLDPQGEKIQAIQFRLAVNKSSDDNTILTFQNIQKGTDISDNSWILDYNVFRGAITGNGASVDSIYVLLYNLNQNGGLDPSVDYNNLFTVKYRIANLPALQDTVKSSFLITHAEASTFEGFPVDITPSRNQLVILGINRVQSLGDVNGDGCLDILDLIMVVDHIVGRDSLSADEFARADIAPWSPGAQEPTPDGLVNVQDLALIQNIILTGMYPNGTVINGCSYATLGKLEGDADAKVTFYINNEGISAYLDSRFDIRGAQIEFGNVINDPQSLQITTYLGQGYYQKINEILRTLMYDRLADKYIKAGEHFLADMPFTISNPEDLTIDKLILVNTDRQKVEKVQVEIVYGQAPSLPLDYILYQNYPNPFNPNTTVRFQVPQTSSVTVDIYNMLGQKVRTLFQSQVQRGTYSVNWDGKNDSGVQMSSGTYIYRMTAGEFVQAKKMVLLK